MQLLSQMTKYKYILKHVVSGSENKITHETKLKKYAQMFGDTKDKGKQIRNM